MFRFESARKSLKTMSRIETFLVKGPDGKTNRRDCGVRAIDVSIYRFMKIQTNPRTQGSVLLVSLLTASVIGVALGSYLTLTSTQHQSVHRSTTWNEGIPVAEAGIDEALNHIRYHGIENLSANNWTWGLDGRYHKQRFVGTNGAYF